ncbi:MAG: ethanolamine ammonia-lyase reactivating factor EutA, partial [Candidatus Limnocylindria bacterium]
MTVGIDIGSTTTHCMFSRLRLQRLASFSSRFVPVEREVLHRSPILFTPYRSDGSIDADALGAFIDRAYADANLAPDEVDTGAVILTGHALESRNAAEIGALFAAHGGKFVCATAGHRLEAILAAHGSGAVARSRRDASAVLNVDVGGGTTKLALTREGRVVATSALRAGARSRDAAGLDAAG